MRQLVFGCVVIFALTASKQYTVQKKEYYSENDVRIVAQVMYNEARGCNDTEMSCVAWTICNRSDMGMGSITEVATAPHQYAWSINTPVTERCYNLAQDVLARWTIEKIGAASVGRTLDREYIFFSGDGKHNYFRDRDGNVWGYTLPSPYEE